MIKLVQGFDIGSPLPIDGRILLSYEEMYKIDDNILPEKYFAFNKEDGKLYLYDKNNVVAEKLGKFRLADDTTDQRIDHEVEVLNNRIDTEVNALNVRIDSEVTDLNAEDERLDTKINNYKSDKNLVDASELTQALEPYSLISNTGKKLHIDGEHLEDEFRFKVQLLNENNEVLSTSEEVDLPLESMVISGNYDSATKEVVLTLKDGNTIRFSVADLIDGLVSESDFNAHVDNTDVHIQTGERDKWNKVTTAVQPEDVKGFINAGENVSIVEDGNNITINAKDTTYTAGSGVTIVNNVISSAASAPTWDLIQGEDPLINEALKGEFDKKLNTDEYELDQASLETLLDSMGNAIEENSAAITQEISDRDTAIETAVGDLQTSVEEKVEQINSDIAGLQSSKQNVIDSANKLGSDLVDDSNGAHKFVSVAEKEKWDAKQNKLDEQTVFSGLGDAEHVAKITTNALGQVTNVEEVEISHPVVGNADLIIQKNGSQIGSFNANATEGSTVNIGVPVAVSELTNDSNYQDANQVTASIASHNVASDAHADIRESIATNAGNIADIETLIPADASTSNQLADKDFVNSSIATNTATFRGTYESVEDLPSKSTISDLKDNDYAFVIGERDGNPEYNRYKYNDTSSDWVFEYTLNNSSFTAEQWAAIQSGITSALVSQITTNKNDIAAANTAINTKQPTLVSGTNIKTVNNSSLLGSGNVAVGTVTRIQVAQGSDQKIIIGGDNTITTSGSVELSHATTGVTPNAYGPTANVSPAPGTTFDVPAVTVDQSGHLTDAATRTVKMPTVANGYGLGVESSGFGIKSVTIDLSADDWSETVLSETENVFTKTVTDTTKLAHITSNSSPTLDVLMSDITSLSDIDAINEAWSKIYRADTGANSITFYATEAPAVALKVIVKG